MCNSRALVKAFTAFLRSSKDAIRDKQRPAIRNVFYAELKDYLHNNSSILGKKHNDCWGRFIGKIMRLTRREILHCNTAVKENKSEDILRILINGKQIFTDNYKDWPVFTQTFFDKRTPKKILHIARKTPPMETLNGQSKEWQFVGQGDYSSIANCGTKIPAVFRGMFGNCHCISKLCVCVCVCVYTYACMCVCTYVYIPPLLAKFCRTTTFRENLTAKHWDKLTKLAFRNWPISRGRWRRPNRRRWDHHGINSNTPLRHIPTKFMMLLLLMMMIKIMTMMILMM